MADGVLPQERLIASVRRLCEADPRVVAAFMYGSFAKGEGDRYSDVEFYVYFREEAPAALDPGTWIGQVAPVLACFVNEFGVRVALFEGLIRGEFHLEAHGEVGRLRSWRPVERGNSADGMILLDRDGELTRVLGNLVRVEPTTPEIQELYDRLLNWWLLGCSVLARGERARALDALGHAHRFLLQLARVCEGALDHWATPSRALETELSAPSRSRYAACTADLAPGALESAYASVWAWSRELARDLAAARPLDDRAAVAAEVERHLPGLPAPAAEG